MGIVILPSLGMMHTYVCNINRPNVKIWTQACLFAVSWHLCFNIGGVIPRPSLSLNCKLIWLYKAKWSYCKNHFKMIHDSWYIFRIMPIVAIYILFGFSLQWACLENLVFPTPCLCSSHHHLSIYMYMSSSEHSYTFTQRWGAKRGKTRQNWAE